MQGGHLGRRRTIIEAPLKSAFAAETLGPFFVIMPPAAETDELAAATTWLLSDDASNVNGIILPCDGGWGWSAI